MIRQGDFVTVYFTDQVDAEVDCQVINVPQGPGDCWRLERQDRTSVNIMHFAKMVKHK